jgi:hypothetical protein
MSAIIKRLVKLLFGEIAVTGLVALINITWLAENAEAFVVVGVIGLIIAGLWDQIYPNSENKGPDAEIREALAYIRFGQWGRYYGEQTSDLHGSLAEPWADIHRKARDGEITVWGKPSQTHADKIIDAEFWDRNQPSYLSILRGQTSTEKTSGAGNEIFYDLKVNKAEVSRAWPSIWKRYIRELWTRKL